MTNKIGPNEVVRERHFLVNKAEKRLTKTGKEYHVLVLSDNNGLIEAKIWENALSNCSFEAGKIIEVDGESQEYNGKIDIIINSCRIVNSEEAESYRAKVPTLVFDIETVGKDFEELNKKEQRYLLENLEKYEEDKEKAKLKTGLYPIFGTVCSVGCYNPDSGKGVVLIVSDKIFSLTNENFECKIFSQEIELLKAFWEIAQKYENFVSYNGEGFDFPYLIIRSGIMRVRVPIEMKRYNDNQIDLMNKIKQNNHSFKLEFLCRAFGIEDPKRKGVDGEEVDKLYKLGKHQEIANYSVRDVIATSELYKIWKEYMSGKY